MVEGEDPAPVVEEDVPGDLPARQERLREATEAYRRRVAKRQRRG